MSANTITFEILDEVTEALEAMETSEEATSAAQAFADAQPVVMGFLLSTSDEFEDEDDVETVLFIANVIHLAAEKVHPGLPQITQDDIKTAEDLFLEQMEKMAELGESYSEDDFANIFGNQPDLNAYLVEWVNQLMDDEVDEDTVNAIYSVLQVTANAYGQALTSAGA